MSELFVTREKIFLDLLHNERKIIFVRQENFPRPTMRSLLLLTAALPAMSAGCQASWKSGEGDGLVDDCDTTDCSDAEDEGGGTSDGGDGGDGPGGEVWEVGEGALATTAFARIVGESDYDYAGVVIDGADDVDGDGHDDVVVGAYRVNLGGTDAGAAYVVYGPFDGDVSLTELRGPGETRGACLIGESTLDQAGQAVAGLGDVDGDGYADIAVGAAGNDGNGSEAGTTYLLRGPMTGDIDLSVADARLYGESIADLSGLALSATGDMTGDGRPDLLIAAMMEGDEATVTTGATYLIAGDSLGDLSLSDANAVIYGRGEEAERSSWAQDGVGDVDGDGLLDLVIGDYLDATSGRQTGSASLFLGPIEGQMTLDDSDGVLYGVATSDHVGVSLGGVGDLDGDGFADVIVGAQGDDTGAEDGGAAFIVRGPSWGMLTTNEASAALYSDVAEDRLARSVDGAGDLDGDGLADLLVGSRYEDDGGTDAGAAYLIYGNITGAHRVADVGLRLVGGAAGDRAGWSVAGGGDLNNDGLPDLLVGAFGDDAGGYESGATYIVSGVH
jgi:FG-GAP repeat